MLNAEALSDCNENISDDEDGGLTPKHSIDWNQKKIISNYFYIHVFYF